MSKKFSLKSLKLGKGGGGGNAIMWILILGAGAAAAYFYYTSVMGKKVDVGPLLKGFETPKNKPVPKCPKGTIITEEGCAAAVPASYTRQSMFTNNLEKEYPRISVI